MDTTQLSVNLLLPQVTKFSGTFNLAILAFLVLSHYTGQANRGNNAHTVATPNVVCINHDNRSVPAWPIT